MGDPFEHETQSEPRVWLGPLAPFILKHGSGRRKKRMPRIKQLLAEGQVVRVFAVGQLLSPKLIEIVGEHGELDALWLDFEHAGISMKEIELATMTAKAYGMDHFRAAAGDRLCLGHAPARSGRGGSGLRGANARPGMPALRPCLRHPHGPRGYPLGQRAVGSVFPGSLNLRSCAAFPAHCGGGAGGCPSRPEKRLCRELPILASTPLLTRR